MRTAARVLAEGLQKLGYSVGTDPLFDTVRVNGVVKVQLQPAALAAGINLRYLDDKTVTIALDETVTAQDLRDLFAVFAKGVKVSFSLEDLVKALRQAPIGQLERKSAFLTHPVFNTHHSENELLRYMQGLQSKDLSLTTSMIPLGSCTMKLNATAEMYPVTWPEFGALHPFAPLDQTKGYQAMFQQLEAWLAEITGFAAISLQPNARSQGEYAVARDPPWHRPRQVAATCA